MAKNGFLTQKSRVGLVMGLSQISEEMAQSSRKSGLLVGQAPALQRIEEI
jgi:hypothetical protein